MINHIVEIINEYFGGDPERYGIDTYKFAWHLVDRGLALRPDPDQLTIEEVVTNEGN